MPRIDPMKLLVCLSVLLAPNGGIRNAGEVRRLANLMAKFSKKLVSKAIYIQILKCTETELLGQFMQTGGWALVHTWLIDGIGTKNWPLIQELMELLLCCPVDVERLKINSTPRLVKSLSTDCAHESVKVLATKLVEQWLYIVKAPKQSSPMVPLTQSELPSITGLAADGKQEINNASKQQYGGETGNGMTGNHSSHHNGYGDQHTFNNNEVEEMEEQTGGGNDTADGGKKTFQTAAAGGDLQQTVPKKTSLVLKITTKNGKQVVAKVIKSSRKIDRDAAGTNKLAGNFHDDNAVEAEDDDEEEDQEEVLVNIESGKSTDEAVAARTGKDDQVVSDTKKIVDVQNGLDSSSSKERNMSSSSSSSKDKDRHHHSHRDHRERDKDRKGSGSGGGSSSRSSSSKSSGSSSSSSSKHKSSSSSSSSKSGSSSSSRSKDKDRHTSSSSSSSKHKSSSSSSSSKSGSSKSSSSDKHRDSKEKSSHSTSGSSSGSSRDSKNQSLSSPKLSRKDSRDDSVGGGSNDSGSETSSTTNTSANGTKSSSSKSAIIPSKKASISIEVRNPENRPKTVKTYNSQFRSHGLIEEAPPPPSRKGLKKPSSSASPAAPSSSSISSSATVGSTAIGTVKRSSPTPASGRDATLAGAPVEKKAKEDPVERPGSIKLIPPKRQHALVESDMFMDALSATLRKDVKKRKRRTSGSEGTTTTTTTTSNTAASSSSKPNEATPDSKSTSGSDAGTTTKTTTTPGSPTSGTAEDSASEATTPTTPTSPKVPTIAPMSFYRDTLAEQDEENGSEPAATTEDDGVNKEQDKVEGNEAEGKKIKTEENEDDDEGPILKKPKRVKCELNEDDEEESSSATTTTTEKKTTTTVKKQSSDGAADDDKTELMDAVMSEVEKKIAEEAEGEKKAEGSENDVEAPTDGKKPPGPGCGPDGPPGVLVIHRRKGPKKQLRWRATEELEEVRYFELDVTERCNVTKSFTDMKQMERVDERQKFMLSRKVGSEDIMVERTAWRPLLVVDNVPPSPDGSQSVERNVQRQRERGCLQALYFNKHMIPDSPSEPDPADIYQTADPVHIPLEDVTGNPDSVNDFTSVPWPDPKSTPPHESGAFNSPFFPSDLPPAAGFGPGGFPPPFAPGAAATIGPGPWNMGPPGGAAGAGSRSGGVLPPGMFPLNQPPPGMGGGGGGSPNMLNLPMSISPNVPPPGMFPGAAAHFNAPPPELGLMTGGGGPDMGGRRGGPPGGVDFRNGPPPQQQWVTGNRPFAGGNNPSRGGNAGGGFGNRGGGGGGGNWNNRNNNGNNGNRNGGGDRGRMGDDGRGNYRGHWLQSNRGHNRGAGGRKW